MAKLFYRIIFSIFVFGLIYVSPTDNPDYVFYDATYNEDVFATRFELGYSMLVYIACQFVVEYEFFYYIIILIQVTLINLILKNFSIQSVVGTLPALAFVLPTFGIQTRWGLAVLLLISGIESRHWFFAVLGIVGSFVFHKSVVMFAGVYYAVVLGLKLHSANKIVSLLFFSVVTMIAIYLVVSVDVFVEFLGYVDYYGSLEFDEKSVISIVYLVTVVSVLIILLIQNPILVQSRQYIFYGACVLTALILKDFAVLSGRALIFGIFYETLLVNSRDLDGLGNKFRTTLIGSGVARFGLFSIKKLLDSAR
jgi:hypothetical protein